MPTLSSKQQCTGCTACAAVCPKQCITMTADTYGFAHPKVDEQVCVDCGICEKICPVLTRHAVDTRQPQAFAAYSKDEAMRMESSSGGVFSELARTIFEQGGIVYGAAYDEAFVVRHIGVENEEELGKLRGAKYARSDLGHVFADIETALKAGRAVMFSSTPCQVAGLKAFLKKDYDRLVCVDFVCHGVPSPMAWKSYVAYRAAQDNHGQLPKAINLRSKETGWSHYRYSNRFEYADGMRMDSSTQSLFMQLFVGDYICAESCASCAFKGYARVSDLTIGDFWGIWDIAPEMDDDKGTSLVLVQSERGQQIMEAIRERLVVKAVTLEEASRQNPSLLVSSPSKAQREAVLEQIKRGDIASCQALFERKSPTMLQKLSRKLRRIIKR